MPQELWGFGDLTADVIDFIPEDLCDLSLKSKAMTEYI